MTPSTKAPRVRTEARMLIAARNQMKASVESSDGTYGASGRQDKEKRSDKREVKSETTVQKE